MKPADQPHGPTFSTLITGHYNGTAKRPMRQYKLKENQSSSLGLKALSDDAMRRPVKRELQRPFRAYRLAKITKMVS
jgi:hypothetical protein